MGFVSHQQGVCQRRIPWNRPQTAGTGDASAPDWLISVLRRTTNVRKPVVYRPPISCAAAKGSPDQGFQAWHDRC